MDRRLSGLSSAGASARRYKVALRLHIDINKRITMPTMKEVVRVFANQNQTFLSEVAAGRRTFRGNRADAQHAHRGAVQTVTITVK